MTPKFHQNPHAGTKAPQSPPAGVPQTPAPSPTSSSMITMAQKTTAVQQALRDVDAANRFPKVAKQVMQTQSVLTTMRWQTKQAQLDRKVAESTSKPKEKELQNKIAGVDTVLASPQAMKTVNDPRCKFVSRLEAISTVKDNKQREAIADLTYQQFGPESKTPCMYMKSSDEMKQHLDHETIEHYKDHYKQEIAKDGSVEGEPLKLAHASLQLPPPTLAPAPTHSPTTTTAHAHSTAPHSPRTTPTPRPTALPRAASGDHGPMPTPIPTSTMAPQAQGAMM